MPRPLGIDALLCLAQAACPRALSNHGVPDGSLARILVATRVEGTARVSLSLGQAQHSFGLPDRRWSIASRACSGGAGITLRVSVRQPRA